MKRIILFIFFLLYVYVSLATHQRAGEITYTYNGGLTFSFSVTTYTYAPSPADRPEIEVFWGDGTSSIIERAVEQFLSNDIKLNKYYINHTFPAAGTYHVTFEDPNRNSGIVNIPNSVNIPFFLETIIVINPFLGSNNSPQLLMQPLDNGCTNVPFYHNPGAYDPDGDSLVYRLINCRGYQGLQIPGYSMPYASNFINIDPVSGDLTWDSPLLAGEYNIAILIEEYRHGIFIGSIVRDMQITIAPCNNKPPVINTITDTCVLAGTFFDILVNVTDDNPSLPVTLTATGAPFLLAASPATFETITGYSPFYAHIFWQTHCLHVRKAPYQIHLKALDSGAPVSLSSFKTIFITIVAPKPEYLTATAEGNNIVLNWSPEICTNAIGYDIYKKRGNDTFEPDNCETGLPQRAGYTKIGNCSGLGNTSFVDDGSVMRSYHNNQYCYRVVAVFSDGAESYASDKICTYVESKAPLLTNVDVRNTSLEKGSIMVAWLPPAKIDSIIFPPPYQYKLLRSENGNYYQQIAILPYQDNIYYDSLLNTVSAKYFYKIEIWSIGSYGEQVIDCSDPSSSIFLNIEAYNKRLKLIWHEETSWLNTNYFIYKYDELTAQFDSIGTTAEHFYFDFDLENGNRYCYVVKSEGGYFFPDTLFPLHNYSQESCNHPLDTIPPDLPYDISVTSDCNSITLSWQFQSYEQKNEIGIYTIYFRPDNISKLIPLIRFSQPHSCNLLNCTYTIDTFDVIIGCFAITLSDTAGNESVISDVFCFDYDQCIFYQLPNMFTPNNDGFNDIFKPFSYKNISYVDMYIYDRWGRVVYKTNDPEVNWDGKNYETHQNMPDGVYYYHSVLYINSLAGQISKQIHGYVSLKR